MSVYTKVKMLCDEMGVSMRKLSSDCGFSPSAIGKWKDHDPSVEKVQKVAERLGVEPNWLMSDDVQKTEHPKYYIDDETAMKAQEAYLKHKTLFSAIEGSKPEDIQMAIELLERLKATNRNE